MAEAQDLVDERQEFHDRRATGLGATDGPKILGLSRYGTPLSVFHEKRDPQPPEPSSLPAWMGLKLQATVAELYTAATGVRLRADTRHHRSKEHPFIVCHLDYRAWGKPQLLVECKTKAYERGWGPDGSTEIPADVFVQVQHEMYVAEAAECHVATLFGHHSFRVYPIARDEGFLDKYIPRLVAFWEDNVVGGLPPAPIGHEVDDRQIRKDHPQNDGTLKAATPEQERVAKDLRRTRLNAAQVKVTQEELENRLKQVIGDADGLTGSFGRITWKRSRDSDKVDWEQVAVTFGGIVEELMSLRDGAPDREGRLARAMAVYETAVSLATTTVPGSRRFLVDFTEEDS